jgi:hypothetical protein
MMKTMNRWIMLALTLVSLGLGGCGPKAAATEKTQPALLEPLDDGTDRKRVMLTEKAAQRIDLQTAEVTTAQVNGADRRVIPYAAVLYDTAGNTWVYTNPGGLTFVREAVAIETIDGDQAVLASGLESAGRVVTVGVAELFGAETGVSK